LLDALRDLVGIIRGTVLFDDELMALHGPK
jgi:hypothetical protein